MKNYAVTYLQLYFDTHENQLLHTSDGFSASSLCNGILQLLNNTHVC